MAERVGAVAEVWQGAVNSAAAHPKTLARTVSRSTARTLVISVAPRRSKNSTGCMRSTRNTSRRTLVSTPSAALTPLDTYTLPKRGSIVYMAAMSPRSCIRAM